MPAMGKELERQMTPDEIALREIQGYIDKVERQAETQLGQANKQTSAPPQTAPGQTQPAATDLSMMMPTATKAKIILPLDQSGVEGGLKRNVLEGVRWLAEWCIMMIKKYPGRVFYMSPQNSQ